MGSNCAEAEAALLTLHVTELVLGPVLEDAIAAGYGTSLAKS
jgi:hypothetical protein